MVYRRSYGVFLLFRPHESEGNAATNQEQGGAQESKYNFVAERGSLGGYFAFLPGVCTL